MTVAEIKRYINDNNKIAFVLEKLSCHHIKEWPDRVTACNPDGDNYGAVNVYRNDTLNVVNYTRDLSNISKRSDIITLIQYYQKYDFGKAIKWLHQILGLKLTYSTQKVVTFEDPTSIFKSLNHNYKDNLEYQILNDEILLDYAPYPHIDFAIDAKLTKSTVKKFQIGYSYNAKRTILPVRLWSSGDLIGVRGRSSIPNAEMFGIPKYFPLQPFKTSHNLYGLWENYDNILKSGKVIVFEGEKSVLTVDALHQYIKKLSGEDLWAVSLFGHELSDEQCAILAGLNLKEIIFAFDKDMPESISWKACEKLYRLRTVSYIYDTNSVLGDHDSPIDQTIQNFVDLYNQRIVNDENKHIEYTIPKLGGR